MEPRSKYYIQSQIAPLATRLLPTRDPRAIPVIERFGIAPTTDRVELPIERLHAYLDELALALEDPLLGHHLAQWRPEGSHGIVEYFWRSASTVEEAAREVARASALFNDTAEWTWRRKPRSGLLVQRVVADVSGVGRHANEFLVTTILREIEKLSGAPARPLRVMFEHPRGASDVDYRALLGAEVVEFGAGSTGVELSDEVLARPISTAAPALLDTLRREAMKGLAMAGAAPAVPSEGNANGRDVDRVRELVRLGLADGLPTLEGLAQSIGTSARSLQRRLADDGTTLRELIERVRMEEAERRLVSEALEVNELARALQFADASAFGRAFRRWTGETPSDFRKKRRPSARARVTRYEP